MKNKTLTQIAADLKLSKQRLSMVLRGERNLSYPAAVRVAKILNCDPVLWLKGGGTPRQRCKAAGMKRRNKNAKI